MQGAFRYAPGFQVTDLRLFRSGREIYMANWMEKSSRGVQLVRGAGNLLKARFRPSANHSRLLSRVFPVCGGEHRQRKFSRRLSSVSAAASPERTPRLVRLSSRLHGVLRLEWFRCREATATLRMTRKLRRRGTGTVAFLYFLCTGCGESDCRLHRISWITPAVWQNFHGAAGRDGAFHAALQRRR